MVVTMHEAVDDLRWAWARLLVVGVQRPIVRPLTRFLLSRVLDTPRSPARPSPGRDEEKNLDPRGGKNGT